MGVKGGFKLWFWLNLDGILLNSWEIYSWKNFGIIYFVGVVSWCQTQKCREILCFYPGQPGLQGIRLFCSGDEAKTFGQGMVARDVVLYYAMWNFDLVVGITTRGLQKLGKIIILIATLKNRVRIGIFILLWPHLQGVNLPWKLTQRMLKIAFWRSATALTV